MKKSLKVFLATITLIFTFSIFVFAESYISSDGQYEYEDAYNLIIITKYLGKEKDITIPTEIDGKKVDYVDEDGKFSPNIVSITVPESVDLGTYAFEDCTSLEKVTVYGNLNNGCFKNCTALKEVNLSEGIKTIPAEAFYGCTSLEKIEVPESVEVIERDAFCDCRLEDENIKLGKNIKKIEKRAFPYYCVYSGEYLLNALHTSVNHSTYSVKDGTRLIAEGAFDNEDIAFIKAIYIPESVEVFPYRTFYKDEGTLYLEEIQVSEKNKYFSSADGVLYNKDKTKLLCYPANKRDKTFTIPDSVTGIYSESFCNNQHIQKVIFGHNTIGFGHFAFYHCLSLKRFCLPKGAQFYFDEETDEIGYGYYYRGIGWRTEDEASDLVPGVRTELYYGSYCPGFLYGEEGFVILPDEVSNLKVQAKSNSVKLSWDKLKKVEKEFKENLTEKFGYRVYVYNEKTKKYVKLGDTYGTAFEAKNLTPGKKYKFAVRSFAKIRDSKEIIWEDGFKTVSAVTKLSTPSFKLTAGKQKATLSWNKVNGAAEYKVYYKTAADGKWKLLKITTNLNYTAAKLSSGKTYYFTVKAVNKTNQSDYVSKSVKIK